MKKEIKSKTIKLNEYNGWKVLFYCGSDKEISTIMTKIFGMADTKCAGRYAQRDGESAIFVKMTNKKGKLKDFLKVSSVLVHELYHLGDRIEKFLRVERGSEVGAYLVQHGYKEFYPVLEKFYKELKNNREA